MKFVIHSHETNACAYYRALLPTLHLYHDLSKEDIQIFTTEGVSEKEKVDVYIFHRIIKPDLYNFIYKMKCNGKIIVWHTDDDLFQIPEWNPFGESIKENDLKTTLDTIKISDAIIVSTESLKSTLTFTKKPIFVLPNLIDISSFEENLPKKSNPVKVLWTGSATHDQDLDQLVEPTIKLIEKYKEKIHFTYWGYLPTGLAEYIRFPGKPYAYLKSKYEKNISYMSELSLRIYFDILQELNTDIAIAPLANHPFNYSKSSIKSLETIMAGNAFIGTNLPPYDWITDRTGILVNPEDETHWIDAISQLIDNYDLRQKLHTTAKQEILDNYSWQSKGRDIWIEGFKKIASL